MYALWFLIDFKIAILHEGAGRPSFPDLSFQRCRRKAFRTGMQSKSAPASAQVSEDGNRDGDRRLS
jgi:hypothetical protein